MKTIKKRFDCVAMKRKGSARVYELTKALTLQEELAFWKAQEARLIPSRFRSAQLKAR